MDDAQSSDKGGSRARAKKERCTCRVPARSADLEASTWCETFLLSLPAVKEGGRNTHASFSGQPSVVDSSPKTDRARPLARPSRKSRIRPDVDCQETMRRTELPPELAVGLPLVVEVGCVAGDEGDGRCADPECDVDLSAGHSWLLRRKGEMKRKMGEMLLQAKYRYRRVQGVVSRAWRVGRRLELVRDFGSE